MTVLEYIYRVEEEMDKSGGVYFEKDDLLGRYRIAAYSFLEQNVEFIQYNQKAREDFSKLTKSFTEENIENASNEFDFSGIYRLVSVAVKYSGLDYVPLRIVQSNDLDRLNQDPFNSPTKEEPLGEFYSDKIVLYPSPSEGSSASLKGISVGHPTFGTEDSSDISKELPIYIQDYIVKKVVSGLMTTVADERFQMQYYQLQNK